MAEIRKGRQTPTQSVVLPYTQTKGQEAIDLYNSTGRTAQEWQELLLADILAYNDDGLLNDRAKMVHRSTQRRIKFLKECWRYLRYDT